LSHSAWSLLVRLATYAVDELVEDRRDPARAQVGGPGARRRRHAGSRRPDLELLKVAGLVVEAAGVYRVPIMDVEGWE
jgi:hypothetical protein